MDDGRLPVRRCCGSGAATAGKPHPEVTCCALKGHNPSARMYGSWVEDLPTLLFLVFVVKSPIAHWQDPDPLYCWYWRGLWLRRRLWGLGLVSSAWGPSPPRARRKNVRAGHNSMRDVCSAHGCRLGVGQVEGVHLGLTTVGLCWIGDVSFARSGRSCSEAAGRAMGARSDSTGFLLAMMQMRSWLGVASSHLRDLRAGGDGCCRSGFANLI